MIQKQTLCIPADKSGVWVVRTIHTYTKLSNIVMPGGFGRISVRDASTDSWLKKKKKKNFYIFDQLICHLDSVDWCCLHQKVFFY